MDPPLFSPGHSRGTFTILEYMYGLGLVNCYRAMHADGSTQALIYARDRRDSPPNPEMHRAFRERADSLRQPSAPSFSALITADFADGLQWAAFAFPEGLPLREYIWEHGRLDPLEGAILLSDLCIAFRTIPCSGVHGMLELQGIYIDEHKRLGHVLHLGIAQLFEISPPPRLYRAPEQWSGERETTQRADIYAAATIIWEAIAGDEPGARSGPDPEREKRLKQRFPRLKSARADVHELLSDVLHGWTSHDENDRPRSWRAAIIEIESVIVQLKEANSRSHTAAELLADDSEPPTHPVTGRNRRRTLPPPPLELAESIPAAPPKPSISSIPPTPRTAADISPNLPIPSAPKAEHTPKSAQPMRAPRNTKRAIVLAILGVFVITAGVAFVVPALHKPAPREAISAKVSELARILRERAAAQIALENASAREIYNSQVVDDKTMNSSRVTRSKRAPQEPIEPADRHAPDENTEAGVYMKDR